MKYGLIWPYMVQYLQFRILEFLIFQQSLAVETMGIPQHPEAIRELVQLAVGGGRVRRDVA